MTEKGNNGRQSDVEMVGVRDQGTWLLKLTKSEMVSDWDKTVGI